MRRYRFENYEELSDYMIDKAQDGFYTVAVLFYNDALGLLRELMFHTDINVEALDIQPEQYGGYDKEYYVSLMDDMVVSVEPAYVGNRYLDAEADLTLIDGEASSAIIKNLPAYKCCEICIDDVSTNTFLKDDTGLNHYDNENFFQGKEGNLFEDCDITSFFKRYC